MCKLVRNFRKSEHRIGAMDLLIASHALFLDSVLVTNNTREFERVPDLKIENWLSDTSQFNNALPNSLGQKSG
jgi:tRNA(fMet)-specific endonuclease VapC